jgi:prepilin-type processing-associated H-X9-DG protein
VLNRAREAAKAVQCQSNIHQMTAGFLIYSGLYKGYLPWTGCSDGSSNSRSGVIGPWDDTAYWANAVANIYYGKSYYELIEQAAAGGPPLPTEGTNSVFVGPSAGPAASALSTDRTPAAGQTCPQFPGVFYLWGNAAADQNEGTPWPQYFALPIAETPATQEPTYWCYVINSKLHLSIFLAYPGTPLGTNNCPILRISQIPQSSMTALVVEKQMAPWEVAGIDGQPAANTNALARGKTAYTRFAGRHRQGGYIGFVDGHVEWFSWHELDPINYHLSNGNSAFNIPNKVIWDPLQNPVF